MENKTPVKKILILAANPKNTPPLRLDKEQRDIEEGLQRSLKRDQFSLVQKSAVQTRDIQRALLENEPQIIHFSGHGAAEEGLVFEDEIGEPKLVSGSALAGLFKLFANHIECVVLNGCYSEHQANVIAQHINFVIGMKKEIGDEAAIEFAVGFYDALAAGKSIEFAYNLGCAAIQMQGIEEHLTPVLLKKSELVSTSPTVETTSTKPETNKPEKQAIKVFFSYAKKDQELRDELAKHLIVMQRRGIIKAWHDHDISFGDDQESEIAKHLNSAQIILLLISPDFISSQELWERDVTRAMQRHQAKETRVIPIILRPVRWEEEPFGKLRPLPRNRQPVTIWKNQDEAFTEIAEGINKVVEEVSAQNH